jgi:two-component system, sensor histidine kinase RegB
MYTPLQLLSASRQNLWRLTLIRVLVLIAQASALGSAYVFDLLPLPWTPLALTLGVSLVLCLLTALRLRGPWPVTELEYAVQLGCDLMIHSVLLYFSGGSTNPFVSYYLVPLTIAAATLPWLYPLTLSGLALSGYTALLIWYHPLHLQGVNQESTLIRLHLIYGMWLNFALSAGLSSPSLWSRWPEPCGVRISCRRQT